MKNYNKGSIDTKTSREKDRKDKWFDEECKKVTEKRGKARMKTLSVQTEENKEYKMPQDRKTKNKRKEKNDHG